MAGVLAANFSWLACRIVQTSIGAVNGAAPVPAPLPRWGRRWGRPRRNRPWGPWGRTVRSQDTFVVLGTPKKGTDARVSCGCARWGFCQHCTKYCACTLAWLSFYRKIAQSRGAARTARAGPTLPPVPPAFQLWQSGRFLPGPGHRRGFPGRSEEMQAGAFHKNCVISPWPWRQTKECRSDILPECAG